MKNKLHRKEISRNEQFEDQIFSKQIDEYKLNEQVEFVPKNTNRNQKDNNYDANTRDISEIQARSREQSRRQKYNNNKDTRKRSSQKEMNEKDMDQRKNNTPNDLDGRDIPHLSSTELQFKVQRLLDESLIREANYAAFIQQQQDRMDKQNEKYLIELKTIKQSLESFVKAKTKHTKEGQEKTIHTLYGAHLDAQTSKKISHKMFSLLLKKEAPADKLEPALNCFMTFFYFTPFIADYIREQFPSHFVLRFRTEYPSKLHQLSVKVLQEENELDTIYNQISNIPFQIANESNGPVTVQFTIPCSQDAVTHYATKMMQVEIVSKESLFVYAVGNYRPKQTGKISLASLLQFEEGRKAEWQQKPISFYCPLERCKKAELSVRMGNRLEWVESRQQRRIESLTPIQLDFKLSYNDSESRMIQRINKFKTAHNSIILGGFNNTDGDKELLFQQQNDKKLVQHRQQCELNQVLHYKDKRKEEFIKKVSAEAIDLFCMYDCAMGTPKFIVFPYYNKEKVHQQIKVNMEVLPIPGKTLIDSSAILESITATLVPPSLVQQLSKEDIIGIPADCYADYIYDEEFGALTVLAQSNVAIVIRVMCSPFKHLKKLLENQLIFDLKLTVNSQYREYSESFLAKLRIKAPIVEHTLYVHGEVGTDAQLDLPFEDSLENKAEKKEISSNIGSLLAKWNDRLTCLSLKFKHSSAGVRQYYLFIYRNAGMWQVCGFEIQVSSYQHVDGVQPVQVGQVQLYKLKLVVDDKMLSLINWEDSKSAPLQFVVQLFSSKPHSCAVTYDSRSTLICLPNKIYDLEVKVQTFEAENNPEKLLIHAIVAGSQQILKKWLLCLPKILPKHKKIYSLICRRNEPLAFSFDLINDFNKQRSYRMYSSNLSLLKVPLSLIPLFGHQTTSIELQFCVQRQPTQTELSTGIPVIMTIVDQGQQIQTYLFELKVQY